MIPFELERVMKKQPSPFPSSLFGHTPIQRDSRMLIEVVCIRCGERRTLSRGHGTVVRWENGHRCDDDRRAIYLVPAS